MNDRHQLPMRACKSVLAAFAVVVVIAGGCGQDARSLPLDPTAARKSLDTALTAWKSGATQDSLKSREPSIIVGDWAWSNGYKLASYKVLDEKALGPNLNCSVELVLAGPQSRTLKQKATYTVTTNPAITVIRDDI